MTPGAAGRASSGTSGTTVYRALDEAISSPSGERNIVKRWLKISLWSLVGAFGLFMALGFTLVSMGVKPTSNSTTADPTTTVIAPASPAPSSAPPAPAASPTPVVMPGPVVAPVGQPPVPVPAAVAPPPAPVSEPVPDWIHICKVTAQDRGVYYLHIDSAQAHDWSACGDGPEAFGSNIDTLLAQPGMDRRCFLPETTDASIAVYSSTGKDLADARSYCDDLGGTN